MEPLEILYADHLDLLFENRNKLYGAYPLRKYHQRRLFAAMLSIAAPPSAINIHADDGPAESGNTGDHKDLSGGSGNGTKDSTNEKPEIFDRPEIMPEFPGGPEALKRFLIRNLQMPDARLEPGSQVRVIAKFVVGPDGKVGGIKMIQSGGKAFDEEVQRVISRMPDWKPGIQHQKKVSVYFNLPVNFVVPPEN